VTDEIYYRSGYKYQITRDYYGILNQELEYKGVFEDDFLIVSGRDLIIKKHYASDGPSGPTIDTKTFMRGAFRHDAGYQLTRLGVYPESSRKLWDEQLRQDCKNDGMMNARAQWVYAGVRIGGGSSARTGSEKPEQVAP